MANSVVASGGKQAASGAAVTTDAFSGVGAAKIVVMGSVSFASGITIRDSEGNTYAPLTARIGAAVKGQLFETSGVPTVSASMTITLTGDVGSFPAVAYIAIGGADPAESFDQENGSATGTTGLITPSEDSEIIIVGAAQSGGTPSTISSPFTPVYAAGEVGAAWGIAVGYSIQTTATAQSATFTGGNTFASAIASFKAAAAGGGGKGATEAAVAAMGCAA